MKTKDNKLLKIEEVMDILNVSRMTIYRHIKNGTLPKPIKIGKSVRWDYNELVQWIEDKKKGLK